MQRMVVARRVVRQATEPIDDVFRTQVMRVLGRLYPEGHAEQRRSQRFAYPRLITLLPVSVEGSFPCGEPIVVAGKSISAGGLSFFHPQPLPFRKVAAVLDDADPEQQGFLIDLDWCRFTRHGWYESGGRFLGLAARECCASGRVQRYTA